MKHTTSKNLGITKGLLERRRKAITISLLVASFLLIGLPNSLFAQEPAPREGKRGDSPTQTAPRLRDIRRISVEEFGSSSLAKQIQERVIAGIIQSGKLEVVSASARSRSQATLRGSVSSNRELTVKVVLLANGNPELWARAVQSASSASGNQADAAASVAGRIVKQLLKAIEDDRNAQ